MFAVFSVGPILDNRRSANLLCECINTAEKHSNTMLAQSDVFSPQESPAAQVSTKLSRNTSRQLRDQGIARWHLKEFDRHRRETATILVSGLWPRSML